MNSKLEYNLTIVATAQGFGRPPKVDKTTGKFEEDANGNIIEDMTKIQIQTFTKNDNGKRIRNTFTLHQTLTDEQLEKMIGKTFIFEDIEQYSHKNGDFTTYTYSSKKIGKQIESKEIIFEIRNSLIAIVDNIVQEKENVIFQLEIKEKFKLDIKDIKLKNAKVEIFKNLLDKKVIFENVKVFKINGKTLLSIDKAPTEVK